jgi:hypothetical protein
MMRLPDRLEQKLWQDIAAIEGESKMRYVTSVERLAIQRGIQQGTGKTSPPANARVWCCTPYAT